MCDETAILNGNKFSGRIMNSCPVASCTILYCPVLRGVKHKAQSKNGLYYLHRFCVDCFFSILGYSRDNKQRHKPD